MLESYVFGLTFDIGHDHSAGGADEPFIRAHKDRLIHMHLHDALGKSNHLALGDGEIDLSDKISSGERVQLPMCIRDEDH